MPQQSEQFRSRKVHYFDLDRARTIFRMYCLRSAAVGCLVAHDPARMARGVFALLVMMLPGCAAAVRAPIVGAAVPASAARSAGTDDTAEVPVVFLEPGDAPTSEGLPVFRPLANSDPRLADCQRHLNNEAAKFIRR